MKRGSRAGPEVVGRTLRPRGRNWQYPKSGRARLPGLVGTLRGISPGFEARPASAAALGWLSRIALPRTQDADLTTRARLVCWLGVIRSTRLRSTS